MRKYKAYDVKRHLALAEKLTQACVAALKKQHRLTDKEHTAISSEGVALSGPPFEPMRVNIKPLIDRGLQLCKT